MTDIATDLSDILKTIRRPGDFYASGAIDLLPPAIEIDGFGPLALPVLPDQATRLIACAEQAPFGRGEETIIDATVRRSWQIAPERVRIAGKRWTATLEAIVARAVQGLGVDDSVDAEFYKLLVYDAGGFFVNHRDTEKSPGMFATLAIALPAISTGGDLIVRHAGREARIGMHSSDPAEAHFAAFYADCVHEVRPVETGCRVTLIYNLIRTGAGKRPQPPQHDREEHLLVQRLDAWRQDDLEPGGFSPAKIVYPLEHAYTATELSFASLKGADAAAAGVLASAAARAQCDLHLALLTIEESGWAEYSGDGRSGRGRWREPDEDDFEIGEILDHSETLAEWRRPDGETCGFGEMPVAEDEFSPPGAVEDMSPDEQHFHEATGNEGASMERTYKRAALVVWPKAAFFSVIADGGLRVSMPYLAHLVDRWRKSAGDEQARLVQEARALAGAMIALWPIERHYSRENETTSATALLDLLAAIMATDRIEQFLMRTDAGEGRSRADNRAVIDALSMLAPRDRSPVIEHLIGDSGALCFAACADLLARAARTWADLTVELTAAGRHLLAFCPNDQPQAPSVRGPRPDHKAVADLIGAACLIGAQAADAAVDAVLSSPRTFDSDKHLVPALCELLGEPNRSASPAIAKLRAACVEHLTARIALPLSAPTDFKRASRLTCACEDCAALARFLDDPALASWSFKAAAPARGHVEMTIRDSHCDVDITTERRGSPHRLLVTKNQASYERLAKQRREDIKFLARIEEPARTRIVAEYHQTRSAHEDRP
jgi:hypothetical protein